MAKKNTTKPPFDSSTGTPEDEPKKRTRKGKSHLHSADENVQVDNNKEHCCQICGRMKDDVSILFRNQDGDCYICSDCIGFINDLKNGIEAQRSGVLDPLRKFKEEDMDRSDVLFTSNIPTPHEIKEYLDQYVIGQDDAKVTLSVAVYNHYKRITQKVDMTDDDAVTLEKNNILICGNSGSGKTFLCKTIARKLEVPCVSVDITSFSAAGYVGDDIESIISRLYAAAGGDVKKTEMGICLIDEFDKLGRHGAGANITRDVNGIDVQQGLLKLLEGTDVMVEPNGGRRHPEAEMIKINTSNILFICLGRFNGIEDVIAKRMNQNTLGFDLTAGKNDEGKIIDKENIVKYAEPDDFRKMGLIQEIVGRLPVITYVNPLTRADLKRILIEPKNSIIKQYKKLFELSGKDLQISDEVYDYIVEKAFGTDTGARGLRNIVEKILKEPMFNSPSLPNKYDSKGRLVKGSNIIKINLDYVKEVESKNYIDPKKKEELEKRTLIK